MLTYQRYKHEEYLQDKIKHQTSEAKKLEDWWRRLNEVFPQLNPEGVAFRVPLHQATNQDIVIGMQWTIPEVSEEFWKKVILEIPEQVSGVKFEESAVVVGVMCHPCLHDVNMREWMKLITFWWGG